MKRFLVGKRSLFGDSTYLSLIMISVTVLGVQGCNDDYSFSALPLSHNSSSAVETGGSIAQPSSNPGTPASPVPSSSPSAAPSPHLSPSPVPSSVPSPVPSAVPSPSPTQSCTETCAVPFGVGSQTCGEPSTCTLTMCNSGYVAQNGSCVPVTSSNTFTCTSYEQLVLNSASQQLTLANGANVPAQDPSGSGTCYYYPVVNPSAPITGASYLTGNTPSQHDQGVVARDHDVDGHTIDTAWHPYIMAEKSMNVTFAGARTLHLTGGSVAKGTFSASTISIDNFFLIGVYPKNVALSTNNLNSYYSAWGTSDATIAENVASGDSLGIAFNPVGIDLTTDKSMTYTSGQGGGVGNYSTRGVTTNSDYSIIPLHVGASGGTAQVPEVSLTNYIAPQIPTSIDFRALDCGGGRYLGNIYLLIQ